MKQSAWIPQITADYRRSPDSLLLGPADDLITYIFSPKLRKQVVQRRRRRRHHQVGQVSVFRRIEIIIDHVM